MIKSVCIRYTLVMIILFFLIIVFDLILELFLEITLPSVVNLLLVFAMAMFAGDYCYKKFHEVLPKKMLWKFGLYFTIIQHVFVFTVVGLMAWAEPEVLELFNLYSTETWIAFMLFGLIATLLLNRFGFSFGINQAKKLADRKKAKE